MLCMQLNGYCVMLSRYNTENGGPALEKLTNAIYDGTKKIKQYFIADDDLQLDYSKTGTTQYLVQTHGSSKFRPFTVQVSSPLLFRPSYFTPPISPLLFH